VAHDGLVQSRPIVSLLVVLPLVGALAGCAIPAQTFEQGVEHLSGPASYVVTIEPPAAIEANIELLMDETVTHTFPAKRGGARYLIGTSLPATLRARIGNRACDGAIVIAEDMEADATLSVEADGCDLRLDLLHRTGTIDHMLEDSAL
jgi:hypothetical protein